MTRNALRSESKLWNLISTYWKFYTFTLLSITTVLGLLVMATSLSAAAAVFLGLFLAAIIGGSHYAWTEVGFSYLFWEGRDWLKQWLLDNARLVVFILLVFWIVAVLILTNVSDTINWQGGVAIGCGVVIAVVVSVLTLLHRRDRLQNATPQAEVDSNPTTDNVTSIANGKKQEDQDTAQDPDQDTAVLDLDSLPPEEYDKRIQSIPDAKVIAIAARRELSTARRQAYIDQVKSETSHMVLWKKNPHPKWLWKRMWWRLPLATIIAGVLIVAISYANIVIQMDGSVPLVGVTIVILAWCWYIIRRYLKWKYLFLIVQGVRFIVQEARIPWFGLKGTEQSVSVLSCGDISENQTQFEAWGWFKSGKLSIDTSRENKQGRTPGDNSVGGKPTPDLMFNLKDVRDHKQLKLLLEDLHDELFTGRTSQELAKRRKIAGMQ